MKKTALVVAVFVFAVLIVLPVVRSVNLSAGKPATIDRTLCADGWPQPPYPPTAHLSDAQMLVADGWPQPPYPPTAHLSDAQTLVADGWPQPPYPPQAAQALLIV
jgi:hypothetical protein